LAVAAGAWLVFDYGRQRAGIDYRAVAQERDQLSRQVKQSQGQVDELRTRLARLETSQRVEKHASTAVRDSLVELQQENQDLREELQFYRNIVSPSEAGSGVRVQDFAIVRGDQQGMYRYTVTLIHIQGLKKRDRVAKGRVQLIVEGTQDGVPRRLSLAQISPRKAVELRYSMRYFKKFEGEILIPDGFVPGSAVVRVVAAGAGQAVVEKKIEWPAAAG
jgi:hypothetical protein